MAVNIVICCDGTDNEVVGDQTNVLRLFRMLVHNDAQHVYYDAGVGTRADPTAQWKLRRFIAKRLDAAIGISVRDSVLDAYRFLVRRYSEGDRIYLFGFSRGAYVVRALAGMIFRCGLLCPAFENLAAYAWSIFSDEDQLGNPRRTFGGAARIKKVFGREVPIRFAGVWDTVSSFGWIWDLLTIPNTRKNPDIQCFRQAISIDETRSCFQPVLFEPGPGQDCSEAWFPGVHADVGGGYPAKDAGLARIALEWILNEAVMHDLRVDLQRVQEQLSRIGNKSQPCEYAKMHDESVRPGWRVLSWFPKRSFSGTAHRYRWRWPNFPRRRCVPRASLIHESVLIRMAHAKLRYRPLLPEDYSVIQTHPCAVLTGLLRETAVSAAVSPMLR